ncbi:MAG: type II secretion system protein [Candidatus Gracilibacteria bacterium]|nr:type II secretion system protein [Candidatus Gracilibacteria bacterium]MDD4530090.1 type II secretion system protein [Candidatus Gracilibacteria bacterium]
MRDLNKKGKKGFTLIELIVVITILAILSTIAFVNFNSFSGKARNSKRTEDLSSVFRSIGVKMADGEKPKTYVTSNAAYALPSANVSIAGFSGTTDADYVGGIINYSSLGIKAADFKDPKTIDYGMAASNKGNIYELAATLEDESGNKALVIGNYIPRSGTTYQITGTTAASTGSDNTRLKVSFGDAGDLGRFKVGDLLSNGNPGTSSGTVLKIGNSGTGGYVVINLDDTTVGWSGSTAIQLKSGAEVKGLVKSIDTTNSPVEKDSITALPYSIN